MDKEHRLPISQDTFIMRPNKYVKQSDHLLRYDHETGTLIPDDGKYGLAFAHKTDSMYWYVEPPYPHTNISWSFASGSFVRKHHGMNAWHHMKHNAPSLTRQEKQKHLNYIAQKVVSAYVLENCGCANGRFPDWIVNEDYFQNQLVLFLDTGEVVNPPITFTCEDCGEIDYKKLMEPMDVKTINVYKLGKSSDSSNKEQWFNIINYFNILCFQEVKPKPYSMYPSWGKHGFYNVELMEHMTTYDLKNVENLLKEGEKGLIINKDFSFPKKGRSRTMYLAAANALSVARKKHDDTKIATEIKLRAINKILRDGPTEEDLKRY